MIDSEWPTRSFVNRQTVKMSSLKEMARNPAIIVEPNTTFTDTTNYILRFIHPEIINIRKEDLDEGEIMFIKVNTEIVLNNGRK